jgi:agmatine deiminase
MTPDWDATHLFLADRLQVDEPALFAGLMSLFPTTQVVVGTHDIWCRDFMPVETGPGKFRQFDYHPEYLRGYEDCITPPETCRLPFMTDYRQVPIVLEGGNVVASRGRVLLTDKIFKANAGIERPRLHALLEEIFEAQCIIVPKERYDVVGHADAVVRFVSESHVLINDYEGIDPAYGARLRDVLEKNDLVVDTLPMFLEKRNWWSADLPSAVGIYLNYLRLGDVVVVPAYDRPEDQLAKDKIERVLPGVRVVPLPCRSLAKKGGVLNCVSWTIVGTSF